MNDRSNYISLIINSLKNEMLSAISNEDPKVIECLESAHINVSGFPIELELEKLFEAAWLWASKSGVLLPTNSDFKKDFNMFCNQLMEPWPDNAFEQAKLKIQRTHKSNSLSRQRYKICRT